MEIMKVPREASPQIPMNETGGKTGPNPIVSRLVPSLFHQTPAPATPPVTQKTALRGARITRLLLTHCRGGFVLLQPLTRLVPRATLYRYAAALVADGGLIQQGRTYQSTADGLRRLAESESNIDWTILERVYAPLQLVPTVQLRALIELILCAIAARLAAFRDDHHAGFVLFGHTLSWKSSLARFVCLMLGLSPSTHVIELGTESGQSLWLRRDARGAVTFQRDILTASFLAFEEYLEAAPKVRAVIQRFLCGRTSIPFENSVLPLAPVCLVTMNARPKASLEERTTFKSHQVRRLVLCNTDQIRQPDLALIGEQALQAAAQHQPLTVPTPRTDCQQYRPQIVRLVRDLMTPEAQPLVEVELVILLCAGMTGFIEDDERAIQQALYNFALVTQTLGWVVGDWLAVIGVFSLYGTPTAAVPSPVTLTQSTASLSDTIILRRPIMDDRESIVPKFSLSEDQRARLVWMSEQEGVPVDQAFEVLMDYYQDLGERDLEHLNSVIFLGKELKLREISAKAVLRYLTMMQELSTRNQTFDHIDAALEMLPALERTGLTPGSVPGAETIYLAARLTACGVTVNEVERWLTGRQRRRRPEAAPDGEAASRE
jgi:hypothetical protein